MTVGQIVGKTLTRFSPGSLLELLALLFPILLMTLSVNLVGFIERVFISRYSLQALEASLSVTYIIRIFQISMVSIAGMAQVYVGLYQGAQEYLKIGKCVWQMIWFSIFSMGCTLPLSMLAAQLFIQGTDIETLGYPYFILLTSINFLFPLNTALTCFFLGRGKTRFILVITILSVTLNLILDRILILGVPNFIPVLGLTGGAFSALISQSLASVILFTIFLRRENREKFGSSDFTFQPSLFWTYVKPGVLRAIGRIALLVIWTFTAHIMTNRGGDYLLVLSIGGTLCLFFSFLGDGICQALVTIFSNLLGAEKNYYLQKALKTALIFLVFIETLLAVPLLLLPEYVLSLLLGGGTDEIPKKLLQTTLMWVWVQTVSYMLSSIFLSLLLVRKDTFFLLVLGCCSWILLFLPTYLTINIYEASPDKFWLLNALGAFLLVGIYI
ncbi:MAG: MATE family efflux transporter, partial [Rhabdochlamydiaceae bacterium]